MAQTYQRNIPALANVTNPIAANDLLHAKAPGVVLGQNIIPGNFAAAFEEAMAVQSYHYLHPNRVTTDEVGLAFERAHAIGKEHAAGIYLQTVAPAGFDDALDAAVTQIHATIALNQAATQRSIAANQAATQAAIADLRNDISIRFDNQGIKRQNENALTQNYFQLLPLKKQVAGRGLGLPGQIVRLRRADLVALGAPMNLPPYPATLAHLNRLTLRELSRLSALFNEDFGIIPGDTVEIQRKKFQKFIG